jgi:environmental stress-induced protein Ves
MLVRRAADYPVIPWKNGGGETCEIAVFPPGAGIEDFDWRISMATVVEDGPFSVFEGIDRTLFILEGDGVELTFEEGKVETIGAKGHLSFPADVSTHAKLLGDAVTDLNIMSRRSNVRHKANKFDLTGLTTVDLISPVTLLFCISGNLAFATGQRTEDLGVADCMILCDDQVNSVSVTGEGVIVVVSIDPI